MKNLFKGYRISFSANDVKKVKVKVDEKGSVIHLQFPQNRLIAISTMILIFTYLHLNTEKIIQVDLWLLLIAVCVANFTDHLINLGIKIRKKLIEAREEKGITGDIQ